MIIKKIKNLLVSQFNIKKIKIVNESKKHKFIYKNYSHFKIIIVSDDFKKYSLLKRHQKIYHILSSYIAIYNIHGLALYTYTLSEWKKKCNEHLISPICLKK
ncbi:MAG: BolA/IbaG family iron-sulfur metabolism protein [Buchnera aphidicola (Nurudea shiraii)]